ncbi:hypothetical protein [Sphingosinicella sp. BN140058]|uniref:hypothetical protein n=1 Tax=Sphingosinicella sp. BN140058 TaxID=1892855 RepID=UPI001FB0E063|nr:hypothetical protein [Sphingosinicella sp. BN140058]
MTEGTGVGIDRYLGPGTKVRRDAYFNDDAHMTSEFGVVVHCWLDDEIGMYDCYVAFFGDELPTGKPIETPYVLRYAAVGLADLDE